MKRLWLFLLLPVLGFAQGVSVTGSSLKSINGQTAPFANATITVCAANTPGFPCTPALAGTLFQNSALTIPLGNSFTSDQNGNYTFFVAPGSYTVTITGSGFAGYSYQVTAQCPLNGNCTWTGSNIFMGPITLMSPAFSGNVSGNLPLGGMISVYNGINTVGNGVASEVAKADATAQAANIGASSIYTVPSNGAGLYRLSGYLVVTQAATVSSTMPSITCSWTDSDSSVAISNFAFTNTASTNSVGTTNSANTNAGSPSGSIVLNAKAGTNISYGTTSYASSGATPMQYAVHVKLEYLGN